MFADRSGDEDGSVASCTGISRRDHLVRAESVAPYAAPGRDDVRLVVTDDDGAAASKSHRAEPKGL